MNKLRDYWNVSSTAIPEDKDPSAYAIEIEQLMPPHAKVCDLGSGSGSDSLYFAAHNHYVNAVDISNVALDRVIKSASKHGLSRQIETIQADLTGGHLLFSENVFDVVYSRLALHYFRPDRMAELFREVFRILKPGGEAYITLKSPDDAAEMEHLTRTSTLVEPGVYLDEGHIKTRFSTEQLTKILHTAGLSTEEFKVSAYREDLGGRKDRVKSGQFTLLLNEIRLIKTRKS